MSKISVFGATGAIGQRFCKLYSEEVIPISKRFYVPMSDNTLYLIGTRDNFNIYNDLHVDVDTNISVLLKVLETIKYNKQAVFNLVSSRFVYGSDSPIPFNEDNSICNPEGFYSITKRCAEQMLICFCNTFGIKYRIFRLTNVLNENDSDISCQRNALQFMIREIVYGRDIQLHYRGEALRDFIYIDDACEAMKICIDNAPGNQIINISNGFPHKFLDIINKTIVLSGSPSKIIYADPKEPTKTKNAWLDTTKLVSYGFRQKYGTDSTLKKLIDFYQKEKEKHE